MIELQYYLSNVPDCLIYGLLAMGIYISLRILDIPDLTTEGSFGFGAVISVLVALAGHPILALFAGMIAGGFAGVITGFLQTKLKVHPVLAGIITMSGLYSINLVCYSLTEKGFTKLCNCAIKFEDLEEKDCILQIEQKGVDMRIGLDIASLAYKKQVDQIVLISGDSDFVSAAKLARREGIDFILDPLGAPVKPDLFEHIDGLRTCDSNFKISDKK